MHALTTRTDPRTSVEWRELPPWQLLSLTPALWPPLIAIRSPDILASVHLVN